MLFPHPAGDAADAHINFFTANYSNCNFYDFPDRTPNFYRIYTQTLLYPHLAAYDVSLKRDVVCFMLQAEVRL